MGRSEAMLSALARGAAALLGTADIATGMARLITGLGVAADVSRVVVVQNEWRPDGRLGMFTLHEWVALGCPSRIADPRLQMVAYTEPWVRTLQQDTPVIRRVAEMAPQSRELYAAHGMGGYVAIPLFCGGTWWGVLALTDSSPDMHWRDADMDALRVAGSIVGSALERAQTEAALRLSEARFRDAIESIDDAFCLFDADDRLVLWNERYRRLFETANCSIAVGRRFEEIARDGVMEGRYPEGIGREDEWLAERMAAHRDVGVPKEHLMSDGRWLRAVERRTADGGTVGVRTDVTDLKLRERELEQARDRAEAANRAKSAFLAAMSHELRTPLNAILGFAEMMQEEVFGPIGNERYRDYVVDIRRSGRHLLSVIDDILQLSRIEAGRRELHRERVAVDPLLDEIARDMDPLAQRSHIQIGRSRPCGATIDADRAAMRDILRNLVSNAIKFSPAGGRVTLGADAAADRVRLAVSDQGIGIPGEDLVRLGQPFVQCGDIETARKQGSGLGVAISRGLVALHGGRMAFSSRMGEGTTVTVELPCNVRPDGLRSIDRARPTAEYPAAMSVGERREADVLR